MSNDIKVGGAYIDLNLKKDNYSNALNSVDRETSNVTKKASSNLSGLQKAFIAAFSVAVISKVVKGIASITKFLNKAGSDAEEVDNKFRAVFSTISKEAAAATAEMAKAYGLSAMEGKKLISNTADIVKGLGESEEQALQTSLTINKLAADLASFNNISVEQASDALTKGYLGQRDGLNSLAISIMEADIQQELLRKGMQNLTGEALKTAKGQITLELAVRQSQSAIGDVERSFNSYANTNKRLQAAQADVYADMGEKLTPAMAELNNALIDLIADGTAFRTTIDNLAASLVSLVNMTTRSINALNELSTAIMNKDRMAGEQEFTDKMKEEEDQRIANLKNYVNIDTRLRNDLIGGWDNEQAFFKDLSSADTFGSIYSQLEQMAKGTGEAADFARERLSRMDDIIKSNISTIQILAKQTPQEIMDKALFSEKGLTEKYTNWQNLLNRSAVDLGKANDINKKRSDKEIEIEKINLDKLSDLRIQYEANKFAIIDNATQAILRQQQRETEGLKIEYEKQLAIAGTNLEDRALVEQAYLDSKLELEAFHQEQSIEQWQFFGDSISNIMVGAFGSMTDAMSAMSSSIVGFMDEIGGITELTFSNMKEYAKESIIGIISAIQKEIIANQALAIAKIFAKNAALGLAGIPVSLGESGPYIGKMAGLFALAESAKLGVRALAEGGLLTGPQLALAGEAGHEAFLPLTNKTAMRSIAQAITSEMPQQNVNNFEGNRQISLNIDGRELVAYMEDELEQRAKARGGHLYNTRRAY